MDKKTEFNQALLSLVEYATVNGNIISTKTVHEYFKDIITDEAMYDAIYNYLSKNQIAIEGYQKPDTTIAEDEPLQEEFTPQKAIDTEKANIFLDMYYDDVNNLVKADEELLLTLAEAAITNDKAAVDKLTEAFLPNVIKISEEFENSGMKNQI